MNVETSVSVAAVMVREGRKERRAEDNDGEVKEDAAFRACVRKDAMAKRFIRIRRRTQMSVYSVLPLLAAL